MKNVLITGVAGYLGSHLAKSFSLAGWNVIGLGHNRPVNRYYVNASAYVDIVQDSEILNSIFEQYKIDVVVHLAGRIEAGISFNEPVEFYSVNSGGTCNLLKVMQRHRVKNIIFSSTAAVYKAQNRPIKEDDEKFDNSPYGSSKMCAEMAIKSSGFNSVIFRYFNLTGADADGEMGESHEPETHLIPKIIENLNNFVINGNDYNTPDGTCIRDYVHVTDISNAHVKAAEYILAGEKSVILNLGTGQGHSILEVINCLEAVTGKKVHYTMKPRRTGDADSLGADISLAKKILNFQPERNMVDILKTAYNWHSNG